MLESKYIFSFGIACWDKPGPTLTLVMAERVAVVEKLKTCKGAPWALGLGSHRFCNPLTHGSSLQLGAICHRPYRSVPEQVGHACLNMLNLKLRFIQTVLKITLLSLICSSAHLIWNSLNLKELGSFSDQAGGTTVQDSNNAVLVTCPSVLADFFSRSICMGGEQTHNMWIMRRLQESDLRSYIRPGTDQFLANLPVQVSMCMSLSRGLLSCGRQQRFCLRFLCLSVGLSVDPIPQRNQTGWSCKMLTTRDTMPPSILQFFLFFSEVGQKAAHQMSLSTSAQGEIVFSNISWEHSMGQNQKKKRFSLSCDITFLNSVWICLGRLRRGLNMLQVCQFYRWCVRGHYHGRRLQRRGSHT